MTSEQRKIITEVRDGFCMVFCSRSPVLGHKQIVEVRHVRSCSRLSEALDMRESSDTRITKE